MSKRPVVGMRLVTDFAIFATLWSDCGIQVAFTDTEWYHSRLVLCDEAGLCLWRDLLDIPEIGINKMSAIF
jgi:hypothetical protein